MAFADEAKKVLLLASTGLHGLETIGEIVKPLLAKEGLTDEVMNALRAITAIVDAVGNGFSGTVSVDDVYSALADAKSTLADNDRRTDADLDAKFPR